MGFYNIFEELKYFFRSIFGKIFIFLIIMLLIIFIIGRNFSYASTDFTFTNIVNNNSCTLKDFPFSDNFIICHEPYDGGYSVYHITNASDISKIYVTPDGYNGHRILFNGTINADYLSYSQSGDITYSSNKNFNGSFNGAIINQQYESYNTTRMLIFTSFDLLYSNGDIAVSGVYKEKTPEIANSLSDLQSLNFDVVSVNAWNWSNKEFDILFYDRNVKDTNSTDGLYPKRVITLNKNTTYFQSDLTADPDKNAIYWIPVDEIGLNLYVGGNYEIRFAERVPLDPPQYGVDYYYNYLGDSVRFTISSDVSQDKINAINKEIEDTTNKKYHDETINKMNSINNNINNVNDALTNTTPNSSVTSDIDNSLNFNNQNDGLNNLNGGFFSRLTTMLSNLLGYNLAEDTSVSIPFPNSEKHLILHSKDIYDNVTGVLRLIINAFWIYIFSFYMWKFINKIYIAISTGNILDTFSSSGEAITNDML